MNRNVATLAIVGLFALLGYGIYRMNGGHMSSKSAYRLKEPMLISTDKNAPYYMIPAGTVLHFERAFDEGHQLYSMEVFVDGGLPAEKVADPSRSDATWIYPISADGVEKILSNYPLTKDDLVRILKARKITRDELAEIVRNWKED